MMNKAVFNYLSKRMIRNLKARKAVELYLFGGLSAYQAELEVFGEATVTVKKIAVRLQAHYEECLRISMMDDRPNMYLVGRVLTIDYLECLEVYVFVHEGDITALQSVETGKDLSELLDITKVYDEVEEQLITILKEGLDSFRFDY